MKATQQLHDLGQSLWLDNITRDLLNSGTLKRYIDELSVTGLTSNPTIFDHAIKNSTSYDAPIRDKLLTAVQARRSSSNWRWRTSHELPTCFGRFTMGRTASMAGCRWKYRPCWHTTQPARLPRLRICVRVRRGLTCSLKSPAPPKVYPRSRKRSSLAFR